MKKYLIIICLFSVSLFAQSQDSLALKEIEKDFLMMQKQYVTADSLQIKRLGIMEYLQGKYQAKLKAIEDKKKLKKD